MSVISISVQERIFHKPDIAKLSLEALDSQLYLIWVMDNDCHADYILNRRGRRVGFFEPFLVERFGNLLGRFENPGRLLVVTAIDRTDNRSAQFILDCHACLCDLDQKFTVGRVLCLQKGMNLFDDFHAALPCLRV